MCGLDGFAANGKWESKVTDDSITYSVTEAKTPLKDFVGNYVTVVYLENLNIKKLGRNSNGQDVVWLLAQGYRVIQLNYDRNQHAVSPNINADIIAINQAIAAGNFCGCSNCSHYQSYILFEGYRIARNVPYFKDDPTVYNTPEEYKNGDSLNMDIVYPANSARAVPVVLEFSYSNSYATYDADKKQLTDAGKNQRLKLEYTLSAFKDSFLEGAPGAGMGWAIADHPKYCPWGKGKPVNGRNDTYKSYETNPDAARKVRSAVRTLRKIGKRLGLSGKIGIFGFSRGSTAGSMAIGDRKVQAIENAGFNIGVSDKVQAAALGPGVFDYTLIYDSPDKGDASLKTRCVWAWGELSKNYAKWQSMGSAYLVKSAATAPVIFFYNTDDEQYYQYQIAHLKAKLDSLHVPTSTLVNYGHGHAVPQTAASLSRLYQFFQQYLLPPAVRK
ncbi:alpha/beta hydrolase family protein [Arachidicoccus sp.]|uniref:alpha/beta hydrolase family protein n=1 Tax=Arachidicoccus sp. TaxID=1872624 RepID=UPI003D2253E3